MGLIPTGQTAIGRILRLPLGLIPPDLQLPIVSGPIRGQKWIVGAATHGHWLGTYEKRRLLAFAEAVKPGAVVYDIGANVGIFTLLACLRAGSFGRVYAFEPMSRNLSYLRRHLDINGIKNCEVHAEAVSNENGRQRFATAADKPSMGKLADDGDTEVVTVRLDDCVYGERRMRGPNAMKIDAEGAEVEILEGARRAIAEFLPAVFVEVHGSRQHAECQRFFAELGYHVAEDDGWLMAMPARI